MKTVYAHTNQMFQTTYFVDIYGDIYGDRADAEFLGLKGTVTVDSLFNGSPEEQKKDALKKFNDID